MWAANCQKVLNFIFMLSLSFVVVLTADVAAHVEIVLLTVIN